MDFFADIFLGAGALGAALYCIILSRRLSRLTRLDQDLGGAIAVMSKQVDEMTTVLATAQKNAMASSAGLQTLTERAEGVSERLELMIASLHDMPDVVAPDDKPQEKPDDEDGSVFLRHRPKARDAA